ncbi:hypothetical protein BDY24DRAFT_213307 [Mrakia frigida]|uniref:uncharacterized protein n=1 Tax=Mrakia frigida TaxID=29902 RepID=UPI003FCBF4D1
MPPSTSTLLQTSSLSPPPPTHRTVLVPTSSLSQPGSSSSSNGPPPPAYSSQLVLPPSSSSQEAEDEEPPSSYEPSQSEEEDPAFDLFQQLLTQQAHPPTPPLPSSSQPTAPPPPTDSSPFAQALDEAYLRYLQAIDAIADKYKDYTNENDEVVEVDFQAIVEGMVDGLREDVAEEELVEPREGEEEAEVGEGEGEEQEKRELEVVLTQRRGKGGWRGNSKKKEGELFREDGNPTWCWVEPNTSFSSELITSLLQNGASLTPSLQSASHVLLSLPTSSSSLSTLQRSILEKKLPAQWIVSFDWVKDSLTTGVMLREVGYEVRWQQEELDRKGKGREVLLGGGERSGRGKGVSSTAPGRMRRDEFDESRRTGESSVKLDPEHTCFQIRTPTTTTIRCDAQSRSNFGSSTPHQRSRFLVQNSSTVISIQRSSTATFLPLPFETYLLLQNHTRSSPSPRSPYPTTSKSPPPNLLGLQNQPNLHLVTLPLRIDATATTTSSETKTRPPLGFIICVNFESDETSNRGEGRSTVDETISPSRSGSRNVETEQGAKSFELDKGCAACWRT